MRIHCPLCRHINQFEDDDVSASAFSFQCDGCDHLLSVHIQVQAMNVLQTGKKMREAEGGNKVAAYIYQNVESLKLPVLPVLAMRIRAIKADPNGTINDVVELVQQDQIMASKILELANSALYGGLVQITDLKMAMMRMGLGATETLVSALENKRLYESKNEDVKNLMEALWRHALGCAVTAQKIAEALGLKNVEEIFSAGLLHDFGYVLVIEALRQGKGFNIDFGSLTVEEFFEIAFEDHCKLGAWYLREKGLPEKLVTIVEHHEEIPPEESGNQALHVVCLANLLCKKVGLGPRKDPDIRLDLTESAQHLQLSDVQLADLEVACEDMVDQLQALLQ